MALAFIFDNIIKPLIGYAVDPIKSHISYPFKYKSNVENLDKKVKKLKETRDTRQHEVNEERSNGKSIEDGVETWLREADEITKRLDGERIVREERAKKKCFGIRFCFPNLKIRYQLSKKAEEEALAVAELQENSKCDRIAYRTIPQPKFVSGDDLSLQSRASLVKEIMDALMVPDVSTIGVHGTGGVGKSTIVKQVAQQAMEEKLFRTVIMADVNQTPNVRKIQGQLADMLGLKFEAEESEWGRASRLHGRLKQEETVLVVLDDLWEKIDLKMVGIPFKDEHEGCKILLTSRDKDVLLSGMGCQKHFGVVCLNEDEAWNLFKHMAGDNLEELGVQSIAVDVAKECVCLPVAIVTVARALRGKELPVWQNALQELKRPSVENFTGVPNAIYSCIELSYNHINSKELKSLFLLCSLIVGYNASIHNLLKHVMGLGLFRSVVRIKEARVRMDSLLLKLKESCLLLDNDSNEQFAVHDVVRDVAVSIASRDHQVFVANSEDELNLLDKETQNKATQIWSRCYVAELLNDLECPQLELFQIFNGDPDPQMLLDNIFEGMQKLRVLSLTNFSFPLLPSSLRLLNNLQTLCLDQSVLGDITTIGELQNLEILSFVKCNIEQLPVQISQLTKLKLLDLSDCSELKVIPQNVISKLSRLEELYMGNSFHQWHPDGLNNASISELENLTHLSNLDIHIRDPRVMSKDMFSGRLQRYRIFIGDVWDWDGVYKTLRTLKLKLDASSNALESGLQMLLKETEDLYLLEFHGVKNIICELDREGFPKLKHLHLQNSPEIQYIIDTTDGVQSNPFPMLEYLILDKLESLEKIYHGGLKAQSPFMKLKTLDVENCHKLKYLMSLSLARCLLQLQNVKVSFCTNMEEIFVEEEEEFDAKSKAINVMEFTQLRFVSLQHLPHLRNFCSGRKGSCLSPTPLFNEKIVFPNLVDLEFYSINIEEIWLPGIAFSIQNLQRLTVDRCSGLKYIFSIAMVKSLLRLKHLLVRHCDSMEEIIHTEGLNEEETMSEMLFPQLDNMELINLEKLTRFCAGYAINCPLLKRLIIEDCRDLKTFVSNFESANMTVSNESPHDANVEGDCSHNAIQPLFNEKIAFPSLTTIEICRATNVERIWHNVLAEDSFCKLRSLKIGSCSKLVNVFPPYLLRRFLSLEVLKINSSHLLEEIFELQESSVEEAQSSYAFQLRDFELAMLSKLKHIWNKDPKGIFNFPNLHRVFVSQCGALKYLFPFSIARDLPRLEKLYLLNCGVEEIIKKEENGQEDPSFVFPQLKILQLNGLPELRNFYSAKHTWQCPMLKSLYVGDCGNVKVFGSKNHGKCLRNDSIQEPFFYVEKVISNLETLSLNGKDDSTSIIWCCQSPVKFYPKVKSLCLVQFTGISDPVPFGFLRKFQNLESLKIFSSSFKSLFLHERAVDEEEDLGVLPKLRALSIYDGHAVRHLWEHDHRMVSVLQNLETLAVDRCYGLVTLAPATISFQNLTTMSVGRCARLLHLLSPTTAISLRQLVKLSVSDCILLKEIVAIQEDAVKDEIIFSRLEYLELLGLNNLASFCSGNYTFKFPSLKEMIVEKCPKMMMFSPGVLSTPRLLGVCWERKPKKKVFWQGNVDATIRQMCTEMVGWDSRSTSIGFSDFPHLKETWHLQPPFKILNNLVSLTVDECPSFSIAIPSNVLQVLSNLEYLKVHKCDSLEGVFDLSGLNPDEGLLPNFRGLSLMDLPSLQHIWNREPLGLLGFKTLKWLEVHNCGSLRSICTPTMALGLFELERIEIANCAMLEVVITEESSEEVAADNIVLYYSEIYFESLPNLTCIHPGNYIREFSFGKIIVHNCPNLKTFFCPFLREPGPNAVNEETEQGLGKAGHNIPPIAPRFNYEVAISSLKGLGVDWNDIIEEVCHGRFRSDYSHKLEFLDLAYFPQECVVFPSHFLGRFTSLEELVLSNAFFEVIVQQEETNREDNHNGVLPRLRSLKLSKLPKLVHLSKEDSLPCLAFQNLVALEVFECGNLKSFSPSAISFQCLLYLKITKCYGLIKLMTSSTAKFLVRLTCLIVCDCELIEEIVANKDNEVQNEVIFHELQFLTLDHLPSLTSFCSGNCSFTFPSMKQVEVKDCPKMNIFSQGVVSTPNPYTILVLAGYSGLTSESDLNTRIHKRFMDMGDEAEQSELPSSQLATIVNKTTQPGEKKLHAVRDEGLPSDDLPVIENPDTNKDLLPVVEPAIETKDYGSHSVLKESEIIQLASRYHEISNDKEDNAKDQFSPIQVDVIETCVPSQVQTGPQITDKGKLLQDQAVHNSSSIDQSLEVPECLVTNDKQAPKLASASSTKISTYEQLTSATASNFESQVSSVEHLLNPSPASSSQSIWNPILARETTQAERDELSAVYKRKTFEDLLGTSETRKDITTGEDMKESDNQMDIDDLLAMLEKNHAIASHGMISSMSSPRTSSAESEVDEKEVHDRIAIVEKILAGGPETLCFYTSIEVVKETLEFLCVNPVDHLVSSERMEIVKKLAAELNNITRKVRSYTEVQSDLNTMTETHRTMMVSSKGLLDEIIAIKEARTKADADIKEAKENMRRLEQQVAELKEVVAAYHENAAKESAKIAAKAQEALDVQKQGKGVMEQIQFRHPNYRKTKKELKAVHRAWDAWKASFGFTQPGKNELRGQDKDPTSPTPTASRAHISSQVQMDPPATDMMDVDDLLAMLEKNQALVSCGVISPVSSPRSSSAETEVDEKEIHDRIAIVEKVLASGPETLCFHFSIEVVKEALEFLCVNPVDHLVSSERVDVVKKLSTEIDDIARKVQSFIEARSNLDTLKETHRTIVASSKQMLDEIAVFKEARAKADADIGETKESLKRLEQRLAELKKLVADHDENATKESAKIAAKAQEALDVQKQAKGVMEQIHSRHPNYRKTKKELKAVHRAWDAWKASFGL